MAEDCPGLQAYDRLVDIAGVSADAGVTSTPPDTRHHQILEAVALAVVSDKPFALFEGRARQPVDAAKAAGASILCHFTTN